MRQTLNFSKRLFCPHCKKGFVSVADGASGWISEQCSRCKHFYQGNLATLETYKAEAQLKNMCSVENLVC